MSAGHSAIRPFDVFARAPREAAIGWDRFWFTAVDPATLAVIRILAGAMLFYTHLVWALNSADFFGPDAWVSLDVNRQMFSVRSDPELLAQDPYHGQTFIWSVFYPWNDASALWVIHAAALVTFALLTVGLASRFVAVLAWVFAISYVQRAQGALFGLDQINTMLAMYLMVGPCGACYSLDAWIARRRGKQPDDPSVSANVAIRLMQLHLCVIYLFAGIGKLVGQSWWNGTGLWGGIANLEYQTMDATWLAWWPHLAALLSHLTVYWEVFYCVLIWPRATRPWMLLLAIPLHLGIALWMGMMTFGLIMLVANLAFVRQETVRVAVRWLFRRTDCAAADSNV